MELTPRQALDQTIVATALPTIGSVFNAYSYQGCAHDHVG